MVPRSLGNLGKSGSLLAREFFTLIVSARALSVHMSNQFPGSIKNCRERCEKVRKFLNIFVRKLWKSLEIFSKYPENPDQLFNEENTLTSGSSCFPSQV